MVLGRPSNGHRRLAILGGLAERMMTCRQVANVETDERGHLLRAQFTRARASRMKATTSWRVDWRRDFAANDRPVFRAFERWVRNRNRVEKALRVRMHRPLVDV